MRFIGLVRVPFRFRRAALGALAAACVAAAGCASHPLPVAEMARASTTIRVAHDVGAGADATASLYMSLATQELANARARASRGDDDGARRWAVRAQIDGDLAIVVAREAGVREAVERSQEQAGLLRDRLEKVTTKSATEGAP